MHLRNKVLNPSEKLAIKISFHNPILRIYIVVTCPTDLRSKVLNSFEKSFLGERGKKEKKEFDAV
jgi:hypothetical protein